MRLICSAIVVQISLHVMVLHTSLCDVLQIPRSFVDKEASHVEGFAPELAIVTQGQTHSACQTSARCITDLWPTLWLSLQASCILISNLEGARQSSQPHPPVDWWQGSPSSDLAST